MATKEKVRGLETIVDWFNGPNELEEAATGLMSNYRKVDKTCSELRRIVESAMNDRGRLLKSKLDRDAIRSKIGTLQSWLRDIEWSNEELCGAIATLEDEIEFLSAAVEV